MESKSIIILAFLQNLWVKNPVKVQDMFDRNPERRNDLLRFLLFHGGLTGKRIKQAFGEDLAYEIIYEECTKEIANNPKTICKPDLKHIEESLLRIDPDLVITFGDIAYKSILKNTVYGLTIIKAPHPAARQSDTVHKLKLVAKRINQFIKNA